MASLSDEIKENIFILTPKPLSLILLDKKWYGMSCKSRIRAKWVIQNYGKANALFHAIRLGENFISMELVIFLITEEKVILSRYLAQRLLLQFGKTDDTLIELKFRNDVNITTNNNNIINNNNINNNNTHSADNNNTVVINSTIGNSINNNISNANQNASKVTRKYFRNPWASSIPLAVFIYLLKEARELYGVDLPLKGNDIESFHFLTGGPLPINLAPEKLKGNLERIEDLILNKKFVPFPPRPTILFEDTIEYQKEMQIINCEKYPAKDGFENNKQLNIIARAILIYPEIVELWKQIGYSDICIDVNNLVLQGSLLILYYPNSKNDEDCISPTMDDFVERIQQFIKVGFKLTKSVMADILFLYEQHLAKIGVTLIGAFQKVKNQSKIEIVGCCIVEAIKINRNLKKHHVLDFLKMQLEENDLEPVYLRSLVYHYFDDTTRNKLIEFQKFKSNRSSTHINNNGSNHLTINKKIIEEPTNYYHKYEYYYNYGYKYHPCDIENFRNVYYWTKYYIEVLICDNDFKFINSNIENPINNIRTLKLSTNLYKWILKNFKPDSIVTRLCFNDIIISKTWIDRELLLHPERQTPGEITSCAFELIIFIYNEFCKNNVPFELVHLNLLKKSNNFATLEPFFEGFLPQIFNINPTFNYHNDNNKKRGLKNQLKLRKQPLFQYLDNREKKIEIEERTKLWFIELKNIHSQINTQFNVTTTHNNDDQFTTNFKTCMKKFWDRIVLETDYINKFESKKRKNPLNCGKDGSKSQRNN